VFRDRKSLRPNEIVERVPALRALADARRVVQDVANRTLTVDAARAQLTRILPRPAWADALVNEVRAEARVARAAAATPSAKPAATVQPSSNGGRGGIDALLDMVDVAAPAEAEAEAPDEGPASAGTDLSRMVAAVARSARPKRAPRAIVGTAPQRLEKAFQNLLDAILHHPEVHRLEATWRGLRLLVESCERKSGAEVDVLHASREGTADALKRLGDADPERPPVDLVVLDQRVSAAAVDLDLLEKWGGLASTLLAPVVLAGEPEMVGLDSLEQVARSTSALSTSEDGRAVAVRGVASREAARWAVIVLNDPLVRAPYTPETSRQEQPPFAEDPADPDSHVFASGAYAVAALCARSHARLRWPTAITGARDGVLGGLPVHTVRDRGTEAAIPLEVAPSEDAVKEVARSGITMLTCAPNTDVVVLARVPALHRGGGGQGQTSGTLSDQLFVGRFARAVQQIAAAIPEETDARKGAEVARIALLEMFERAAPSGPEITTKIDGTPASLTVTVRPRRFAGIGLEELTLGAALG
jgi:type VI secretion system ImpC/EvpB family protein